MSSVTRRALIGSAVGAAYFHPFPVRATPGAPTRRLTVAMPNISPVVEPADSQSIYSWSFRVEANAFESPSHFDYLGNWQLQPRLAESIVRRGATTFDVKLRPGVRFHDGTTMSADDWVLSLGPDRLLGAHAKSIRGAFQPTLADVTKVDLLTVLLTTAQPDPVFEKRLAAWGSQIVSGDAFRKARSWAEWSVAAVGTGPYRVTELRRDERVRLEAHADYWGGRPPLGGLEFRAVPERASRVAGLFAGDYDLITDVTPDLLGEIEKRPGFQVVGGATTITRTINFDVRGNPQLADVNLRRALCLAIDRKLIVDSIWDGRIDIPNGFQQPIYGALYDPGRKAPEYDPDRARSLIKASSYRGEPILLRVGNASVGEELVSEALVSMWKKVGINVGIERVENFSQLYKRPGSGMYNTSASLQFPDPLADFWRGFGSGSFFQRTTGFWSNDEFNRLGRVLETSLDIDERRAALSRMLDIFEWDDPPAAILYHEGIFYGMRSDVEWRPYPTFLMEFGPGQARSLRP